MQTSVTLDDGSATAVQLDGTIYRYADIDVDEMILIENGNDIEYFSRTFLEVDRTMLPGTIRY